MVASTCKPISVLLEPQRVFDVAVSTPPWIFFNSISSEARWCLPASGPLSGRAGGRHVDVMELGHHVSRRQILWHVLLF